VDAIGHSLTGPRRRCILGEVLVIALLAMQCRGNAEESTDQETRRVTGSFYPIRNGETVFELTYTAQLASWWMLQSDLQYFVHPGGSVPDPNDNTWIIGLRTTVSF
jgi:porin